MKKYILIFLALSVVISTVLFLFPINLFDGEIVYQSGLQRNVIQAPLSLSYFLGHGLNPGDLANVETFYLLPAGYLMAFIFIIGIPVLVSYRIYLGQMKKQNKNKNV